MTRRDGKGHRATTTASKENPDFRAFLRDARIDIAHAKPHASEFDPVLTLEGLASLRGGWGPRA